MRARRRHAPAIVSVALILVTAAVALPAGADANGSGATLKCPTSGLHPSVNRITARGTSCPNARKLETEWRRAARPSNSPCDWVDGSTRPGICTIAGWRCVATHTVNGQTYATVCDRHRGRRQVRFILPV